MDRLLLGVCLAFGVLFLVAASHKVGRSAPLGDTLEALGMAPRHASRLARVAPAGEVTGAMLMVAGTWQLKTLALVLASLAIGAVGARAVGISPRVTCSCFGLRQDRYLGWRQLVLAAILFVGSVIVLVYRPALDPRHGALLLAAGATTAASVRVASAAADLARAIGYRRVFERAYPT